MKKQKKQSILNAIIVVLVVALIMMIGSIIYEEKINMSKQPIQNINVPTIKDEKEKEEEQDEIDIEEDDDNIVEEEKQETPKKEEEEYIGEEENQKEEEPKITTDQKVIDLVKKEWGEDDSVIFSIEKKNGNKYRVAVRNNSTTVLQWYEVNTETWEISEY